MNTDTAYFKKDIVNSINAFNELEKVRLNYVPKKKVLILNQSNIPPDMMNTIRNNNAYEDEFGKHHNKYKYTAQYTKIYTAILCTTRNRIWEF